MSTTDTIDHDRGARLATRISHTQKTLFQRAADLSGRSLSEFVVTTLHEAASKVVQAHEVIQPTKAEQTAFVKALLDPPAASARLRRAYAEYKKELGL